MNCVSPHPEEAVRSSRRIRALPENTGSSFEMQTGGCSSE
jgi:hypothetical protein